MITENRIKDDVQKMDFETAFTALQENVAKLECEELSLSDSLALYQRGQVLAKHCADLLEKAELQVHILAADSEQAAEIEE